LGETFTNETNLSSEGMTFAERERRWWSPLKTILAAAKGDMTFAKQLIRLAVEQGRKSRLTLASPQSIEQIAIALSATTKPARRRRGGDNPPAGSALGGLVMAQLAVKPQEMVYTPAEVARYTLDELERRRTEKAPGVPFGIGDVDAVMTPLRPGQLVIVMGRPGNYKSGMAQWWARRTAQELRRVGAADVVTYTTLEMPIEELGMYDLQCKRDSTPPLFRVAKLTTRR
jgi:hypothetical protein